jgi:hypothetical protein
MDTLPAREATPESPRFGLATASVLLISSLISPGVLLHKPADAVRILIEMLFSNPHA